MDENEIIALAGESPKAAFVHFVDLLQEDLTSLTRSQATFASKVKGFLRAYPLDIELPSLQKGEDSDFENFDDFLDEVTQATTQFRFEAISLASSQQVLLPKDTKNEILALLGKVRKIVNQEVEDGDKKAAILKKLSKLENEVSLDRTTFDALLDKSSRLTKALGKNAENLEPLAKLIEKIKGLVWDGAESAQLLNREEELKRLKNKADENGGLELGVEPLNDDIPF